ncbi:glycoside hydrolase family 97 protein, partial [Candidatus Saccharibacteria bacterium]|nr:glycoside hydrolase family 97 protein [Candidatus Saccharibacteria bacterium]
PHPCYNKYMFWWAKDEVAKEFHSPNGRIKCRFVLKNSQVFYTVEKDGKPLIKKYNLNLVICGMPETYNHLKLVRAVFKRHDETVEMPWGEDRFIKNCYHEATFYLAESKKANRIFTIRFRVFDEGVAFRYEIPPQPQYQSITIKTEQTEFNLDLNSTVWCIPAYEPDRYEYNYEKYPLHGLNRSVHTPLTIHTPNGFYVSLHEAALYNYGSMTIQPNSTGVLTSDITPLSDGTKAHVNLPFNTPWRVIMIADSCLELTENRLIYALNDPPRGDFSWVKPLKFIGIWWAMYIGEWTWAPGERHGATTAHAKEYIDSAVRLGIKGLLIEGWNDGWEGNWLENGKNNKFTVATPDFNLETVASYAREKNIELVGHHETVGFIDNYEAQLESAYNYYAVNGIGYIKTGYAGSQMLINGRHEYHHSQLGVNHYQKTVELAAKKHICLDIHEPIKGTGLERTWPNLLAREGARGQEYEGGALSPSHACFLPYTRLLAGGMDYTPGIFDLTNNVKRISTTLARQLAYFVTIYSGMTMSADRPYIYEERFPQVFEFIRIVPNNFEKTLPLAGEIGEYYIVARKDRDSDDWYIGGVTNETARSIRIALDFLAPGAYQATIYADSKDAHYRDNPFGIEITKKHVGSSDTLDLYLAPGGGFAIALKKVSTA